MERVVKIARQILEENPVMDNDLNGLNALEKELLEVLLQIKSKQEITKERLDQIQETLFGYMQDDFSKKIQISDQNDDIDALSLTINFLGDELETHINEIKNRAEEKEVLLKEIHHRVKNNMQVITSLLSLQSGFIDDEKVKNIFRNSQYRINSMATVHEMLYKSENLNKINYNEYLKELVNKLVLAIKGHDNKIRVLTDVPDIFLNLDTAIPLGLLINEIVTNSLKYGFENSREGEIIIRIKTIEEGSYIMDISDNGVGFTMDQNFSNTRTLGLKLIYKLAMQLKGEIKRLENHKGTYYQLQFKEIKQNGK